MAQEETRTAGEPADGDAPDQEHTTPEQPTPRRRGGWARDAAETLLLTAVLFFGIRAVVQSYRVEQQSMLPNLIEGERLFVNRAATWRVDPDGPLAFLGRGEAAGDGERHVFAPPRRGDVVVFRHPETPEVDLIKRVIGVPGDRFTFTQDGAVLRNGEPLEEPYARSPTLDPYLGQRGDGDEGLVVPEGHLFVMGDNRPISQDSREFGPISMDLVVGTAMFTYWPLAEWGDIPYTATVLRPPPAP